MGITEARNSIVFWGQCGLASLWDIQEDKAISDRMLVW